LVALQENQVKKTKAIQQLDSLIKKNWAEGMTFGREDWLPAASKDNVLKDRCR
jgi:hypothetical protein